MPNIEMLREAMELVEKANEVDMWVQSEWLTQDLDDLPKHNATVAWKGKNYCGTAGCFAGWTVMLDGWVPEQDEQGRLHITKDGRELQFHHAQEIAQDLLGLTDDEADLLFDGGNTIEQLRGLVDEFCEEAEMVEESA